MRFNHQDSPDSGRNSIGFRTSRSENEARMNLKKGTLYFITGKFITKSCQENCGLAIFWISYFNHHLCKLRCISSRRNLSKIEFASSSRFWSSARFWSSGRFWSSISKFEPSRNSKFGKSRIDFTVKNQIELLWSDLLPNWPWISINHVV